MPTKSRSAARSPVAARCPDGAPTGALRLASRPTPNNRRVSEQATLRPGVVEAAPVTVLAPVDERHYAARPLFLRWLCIATASALLLAALGVGGFADGVSGGPLAVTVLILAATG